MSLDDLAVQRVERGLEGSLGGERCGCIGSSVSVVIGVMVGLVLGVHVEAGMSGKVVEVCRVGHASRVSSKIVVEGFLSLCVEVQTSVRYECCLGSGVDRMAEGWMDGPIRS